MTPTAALRVERFLSLTSTGGAEAPVRALLFGAERFSEHGRSLAAAQGIARESRRAGPFFPRLDQNLKVWRAAIEVLRAGGGNSGVDPAQAWLLDNAQLVQRQIDEIRRGLPRRYFQRLPRLADEPLTGLPRIYGVAWAWVAHSDSTLDLLLLQAFLVGHQAVAPLALRELWALPSTLRVVLVENLRRLAERTVRRHLARRKSLTEGSVSAVAEPGADSEAAADHQSIRNAIGSLRDIASADWRTLFEKTHPALLALHCNATFAAERKDTQDCSVHAIEALAAESSLSEADIAQAVVQLAAQACANLRKVSLDSTPEAGIAPLHWLCGLGRPTLRQRLGLGADRSHTCVAKVLRRHAVPLYLGGLGLLTTALLAMVLQAGVDGGFAAAWPTLLLAAALALLPASEAVVALVNRLISESAPPDVLPRLAWPDGIPAYERTLVVMPCILASACGVATLLAQLERHWLANREPNAQFALLSDGVDSITEQLDIDQPLLDLASQGMAALNQRHGNPAGVPMRFLLLHRRRRWSPSEGRWIGWERKRGKIELLLSLLASAGNVVTPSRPDSFVDLGALSTPASAVRHLVTLDADTAMPPGTLRDLVGVAAHPINRPVLRALPGGGAVVVMGHGMLQPRVTTPLISGISGRTTWFYRLFGGQGGVDPYSAASSEVYQDLFGEGSATGKGLFDVAAGAQVLVNRLPNEQVLSHDLLEGSLMRCAGVSDVVLIEDAPMHPDVAASRIHRWTRGDWQLLPFLLHPQRWGLRSIHVWKMLDNLRRSLVAPAALALLLVSWLGSGKTLSAAFALGLVLAAYGAGPLMGAIASLAPRHERISLQRFYRHAAVGALRVVGGVLWHMSTLLAVACAALDAVGRSLWRQWISRRRLLEWTTAAAAEAAARSDFASLWRHHHRLPMTAAVITVVLVGAWAASWPVTWAYALPLLLVWASEPVLIAWASKSRVVKGTLDATPLHAADQDYLLGVAKDTWDWFERWVTADDNFLPPDNVQFDPDIQVAHRTSPTNIGLYLLSACCAREFAWLDDAGLVLRLARTLDSVEKLERFRGHVPNWIDTQRLSILTPAYVSTVDSGNLCAFLLVAAAACETFAKHSATAPMTSAPGLLAVAARMRTLALAHEFGFLYDARRKLLHIGMQIQGHRIDPSHYDLLATEARLASLVAIAKGDIEPQHWGALGRPFFSRGQHTGLKSWSGSMFETLMPALVLDEPPESALAEAALAAVQEQQRAAKRQGDGRAPWGVSESAHAARDHTLAYQYGPQGAASLALRDTPPAEHVIAPYATLLALMVTPRAATLNLRRLQDLGARHLGVFIEALDYTVARQPEVSTSPAEIDALQEPKPELRPNFQKVGTWMSHHQGMGLVALTVALRHGAPRLWAAAEPHLAASRWLMHERAPHEVAPLVEPIPLPQHAGVSRERLSLRLSDTRSAALPASVWLGNGRLGVLLREHGAGCTVWRGEGADIQITRHRDELSPDPTQAAHGHYFYLCEIGVRSGSARLRAPFWKSLTACPAPGFGWRYAARLHPALAEFSAEGEGLQARTEVWVAAEDDVELRRVTLRNTVARERTLALVSVFEPVLASAAADTAHPAFGKLFLQARWDRQRRALHLLRVPRSENENRVHVTHALLSVEAKGAAVIGQVGASADRAAWLGRSGSAAAPAGTLALASGSAALARALQSASGELDTGRDPLALIHLTLTLPAHSEITLTFATAAIADLSSLDFLLDKLAQPALRERTLSMAHTMASIRSYTSGLDGDTWRAGRYLETLLSAGVPRRLVEPKSSLAKVQVIEPIDRTALWRHGISGDAPMLLIRVADTSGLPLVRQTLALLDSRPAGPFVDVVLIDAEPISYLTPLGHTLRALVVRAGADPRVRAHVVADTVITADTRRALEALAGISWVADARELQQMVQRLTDSEQAATVARAASAHTPVQCGAPTSTVGPAQAEPPEPTFDAASGACRFQIGRDIHPLRPWINVLANAQFGCHVSERGAGMTWAGNSRLHQITPWTNDALTDPPGEMLILHCLDTEQAWLLGRAAASVVVAHAPGVSTMAFTLPGLVVQLRWTVDALASVKQCEVTLHAAPGKRRRLRLLAAVTWQLGPDATARVGVQAQIDSSGAIGLAAANRSGPVVYATQADTLNGFGGATAWLAMRLTQPGDQSDELEPALALWPQDATFVAGPGSPQPWAVPIEASAERRLLFDAAGTLVAPHALDGRSGQGTDPAGLLAVPIVLEAGQPVACCILLGHAPTPAAARALLLASWPVDPRVRLAQQRQVWRQLAAPVQVSTPDARFDCLVNHWLPAQVLAGRLWARAGFYQAGGAFGFRDQIQDAMALVQHAPQLLAAQIRRHAARQFEAGDVQHWWHEPSGAGVRTKIADDRLWLVLALALYVQRTGDSSLLDEVAPFVEGREVPPGAEDIYDTPTVTSHQATLYEHAARAVDASLAVGAHGLPLFGSGDWNDGMNRVGNEGRGESVWMGFFLIHVIDQVLPLAQARSDNKSVQAWRAARSHLAVALDSQAWDGDWYLRGWFDDGSVLGTQHATECRIDLIVQAWAVLSDAADPARAVQALRSLWRELHDTDAGLLRLLWPPLQHHQPRAGYIQAYPAGVRENGGQYNHGAVWALMASAKLGWAARTWQAFTAISPMHRSATAAGRSTYGIEPFVVAGDIETVAPHAGRGGWSWYTGAAGWLLRAAVESIIGVRIEAGRLHVKPCLPPDWPTATVQLQYQGQTIRVHIFRNDGTGPDPDTGALHFDDTASVWLAELPRAVVLHVAVSTVAIGAPGAD